MSPEKQTPSLLSRALREPLLHFVAIALVLFVADHWISRWRDDHMTIEVTQSVEQEARDLFKAGMKRDPTPADLKILLERWVDNEVLYREGLALGLDRGDQNIRERVIFKALSVTQAGLNLPPISQEKLREWFEAHRDTYDVPSTLDFFETVVSGEGAASRLQEVTDALNSGRTMDVESSLRVFRGRPRTNLVQSYGEAFAHALESAKVGSWMLIDSKEGPRVVRLERITPGLAADYEALKEKVMADWRDQTMSQLTSQAIREMGKKYKLRGAQIAS